MSPIEGSSAHPRRPSKFQTAVLLLLATLAFLLFTSLERKCATSDEVVHLLGGATYWKLGDFRINPENGNLPQRWMAIPLLFFDTKLPDLESPPALDEWSLAQLFFYEIGNDPTALLRRGRFMMSLLAIGLGLLVYFWSARLNGPLGGILSLFLYVFSTAILANGGLLTSDLAVSFLFLASIGAVWRMLEHVTWDRVLVSSVTMGLLFAAKMSAPLIIPTVLLVMAAFMGSGRDLEVLLGTSVRRFVGIWQQGTTFFVLLGIHGWIVLSTLWALYGFRFSAVGDSTIGRSIVEANWKSVLDGSIPFRSLIVFARDHHLLPEAYLYGQAFVLQHSQSRWAFLDGAYNDSGWWWFFPYTFLVKTSPFLFVIVGLGLWKTFDLRRSSPDKSMRWLDTVPLWSLLFVYWSAAMASHLNIGHRHVLLTYPVVFILCGGLAPWMATRRRTLPTWICATSLILYAAEAVSIWPNYLTYISPFWGGPAQGYRYLVDSSFDWGQDLPALKQWLEEHGLNESPESAQTPVYLSYFGTGSPTWHGIKAMRLGGHIDIDLRGNRPLYDLRGGYYCISATMLAMVLSQPRGPWSTFYEQQYQSARADVAQFLSLSAEEQQARQAAQPTELTQLLRRYDALRTGRLFSYLRQRRPDDNAGFSILVYRLSDAEVEQAISGPPVELIQADGPLQ